MQRKSDDRRYDRSIRSEETRANEFAFRNYYYLIDSFVLDAIVRHNQATSKISRRLEISRFFPLPRPIIIIIIIPRTIERSPRVAITAASRYLIARVDCYLFSTLCLSVLRGRAGENYLVGANFFPFSFFPSANGLRG